MTKKMDGFPVCPASLARHCTGENRKKRLIYKCLYIPNLMVKESLPDYF